MKRSGQLKRTPFQKKPVRMKTRSDRDFPDALHDAWESLSKVVRMSYADRKGMVACYTCPTVLHWKDMHGGHLYTRKSKSTFLVRDVVKPQCPYCNIHLEGNVQVFRRNIIRERGEEFLEQMDSLNRSEKKFTIMELQVLKSEWDKEIREYESKPGF